MIAPVVASRSRSYARLRSISRSTVHDTIITIDSEGTALHSNTSDMTTVVTQTTAQRPQTLRIRDKLPLEKRARVNIQPKDPEFIETERYFAKLLGDDSLTLDRILKDNFSAHEIDKFIPTNRDPMATWQREDAIRYNELLSTRFKGITPTLACKMAMLYHGLPAAPMKMMVSQVVDASDFEDLEGDRVITTDPLDFLDEQGKRTYEDDPSSKLPLSLSKLMNPGKCEV
jgi:hypothetical protein